MIPNNLSTSSPEALRSYVQGRDLFDTFLKSGRGDDLKGANRLFRDAVDSDPTFQLAKFFLAVSFNELREHDAAIERLTELIGARVLLPEAYLHLAYAKTKKYTDSQYYEAEEALQEAERLAQKRRAADLVLTIQVYRVFLYAVMGGRLVEGDRAEYRRRAIELGEKLRSKPELKESRFPAVRYELLNALGIAYMREGEHTTAFSPEQSTLWEQAQSTFDEALSLHPNAFRTLQNVGTLDRLKGDQKWRGDNREGSAKHYWQAVKAYKASLINPNDQFPYYALADCYAKLGEWEEAERWYDRGRWQKGSVKEETWDRLLSAIKSRNAEALFRQ